MGDIFWIMVFKSLILLAFMVVTIPFVMAFKRFFPEGKVKRLLLRKIQ
jgi:hypothetical protein